MTVTVERVERELNISKDELIKEGIRTYLEFELRSLKAEILSILGKHNVHSFNELWGKLEKGKVSESECFDDLTKLEYLEIRAEKVESLLKEHITS
jgi:hypothetical protein